MSFAAAVQLSSGSVLSSSEPTKPDQLTDFSSVSVRSVASSQILSTSYKVARGKSRGEEEKCCMFVSQNTVQKMNVFRT